MDAALTEMVMVSPLETVVALADTEAMAAVKLSMLLPISASPALGKTQPLDPTQYEGKELTRVPNKTDPNNLICCLRFTQ